MKAAMLGACALASLAIDATVVTARPLAKTTVRAAVETWVRYVATDSRPDAVIERMEPYLLAGDTVAYVAHLAGSGFCLCGADDLVVPVSLYNPTGDYDPGMPDLQDVLQEIAISRAVRRSAMDSQDPALQPYRSALANRAARWRDLADGRIPAPAPASGDRDLPSRVDLGVWWPWDQHVPYAAFCPIGDGGRTLVGCVATAGALILRYWQWPPIGLGSHTYWWGGDGSCGGGTPGSNLSADYSDTYDWLNMPDDCAGGCTTTELNAVAELCYETAVAVNTDFGVCASTAFTGQIVNALHDHFYFDADGSGEEATILGLTSEIAWLRPVEMAGFPSGQFTGHAWVVYGYDMSTDPDRSFLCNIGWGQGHNAVWYQFDSIPWPSSKFIARYLAPEGMVRFVATSGSGDGSPGNPFPNLATAIAQSPDGATFIFEAGSSSSFNGIIARPFTLRGLSSTVQ